MYRVSNRKRGKAKLAKQAGKKGAKPNAAQKLAQSKKDKLAAKKKAEAAALAHQKLVEDH